MITAGKRDGRWRWCCRWCSPPTTGSTETFTRMLSSLRHHLLVRYYHHQHVARERARRG